MPSDHDALVEPAPAAPPERRRAIQRLAGLLAGLRHLNVHAGHLRHGLRHAVHWSHAAAALVAFSTEVVKPILPHCPLWLLGGALLGLACLVLAMRYRPAMQEKGWAILVFCGVTAVASGIVITAEALAGGEHGSVCERVVGCRDLQQWAGVIEKKIDRIDATTQQTLQAVQQADALAEKRQAELKRLVIDAAGGGAPAVQAIADIRALLRPGSPDIDTIPAEQLPGLVQRILDDLRKPAARAEDFTGTVRRALEQAQAQAAQLEFAGAQRLLDAELAKAEAEDQTRARGRSALLAERARVAGLQLHYREAAEFYAKAADAVSFDPITAWARRLDQAHALYTQGDEFGDNEALRDAVRVDQAALTLAPRGERPDDWAGTQNNLGNALWRLGERESGTARLEQAVEAYRAALLEYTRERVPLNWAMTQNNLGAALQTLGERESGTARLEEAVAGYRAALLERTRERVPLNWATTQNNLGTALQALGERESGTARLEQAVEAFRAALLERTREHVPLDWAMTQNNLGNALQTLGERESGTARLEQAVEAYRAALLERTRERVPLDWAATQYNLASALATLAQRRHDRAQMTAAIAAMRNAAAVFRQGNVTYWLPIAERRIGDMEAELTRMTR